MVFGTYGDRIIFWDALSSAFSVYDCVMGSVIVLCEADFKTVENISSSTILNNNLFFVEGYQSGTLKVIEGIDSENTRGFESVEGVLSNIVSIASTDDYIVCAVKERPINGQSQISFYYLYPDGRFTHIITWDEASFWSLSSFRMAVADGHIAACITTQEGVFTYKLKDPL